MKIRMLKKGTLTWLMTSRAIVWPAGAQSRKFRRRCLISRPQASGLMAPPGRSPAAACRSLADRVGLLSSFLRWPSTAFTSPWGVSFQRGEVRKRWDTHRSRIYLVLGGIPQREEDQGPRETGGRPPRSGFPHRSKQTQWA